VQPYAEPVTGFEEYFLSLTPATNRRNPWFAEYWEDYFRCRLADDDEVIETPFNQDYAEACDVREQQTADNGFELEAQLQFVSDAVMAFAYALKVYLQ
jgi:metabotropic X receptor